MKKAQVGNASMYIYIIKYVKIKKDEKKVLLMKELEV